MSNDSDWNMPAIGQAAIDHNIRIMAQDLKDLGYAYRPAADIIAWSEALTFINPAYYGTRWSDAANPEYQAGLLSWTATVVRSWLTSHGYANNSGYGQILFFDAAGPSMLIDINPYYTPAQYWNIFIKQGQNVAYQLYYHYFKGWIPDAFLELLYDEVLNVYRSHILEIIDSIYHPPAPAWLLFSFNKKKGGGKLVL